MRILRIIPVIIIFIVFASSVKSQTSGFGAGVIFGEPTGLSAKYWTNPVNAFDFALGYSFVDNGRLHVHADYVWHVQNLFDTPEHLVLYYGPGARLKTKADADARFGIRGVAGIIWIPRNSPIDVFLELAPILDIIPETAFHVNAGIGLRYFFH